MSEKTVPADLLIAAKRGFIRTTAQSYATSLSGGISASAILAFMESTASWEAFAITWIVAALSPLLAGLGSYLSIIGEGIPSEYQPEKDIEVYVESDVVDELPPTITDQQALQRAKDIADRAIEDPKIFRDTLDRRSSGDDSEFQN